MDSRKNRVGAVAASIVLLVVALLGASLVPNQRAGTLVGSSGGAVQALAASGLNFDYVVIILMENHNICDIYTHCGGTGTYMTALADAYSIALQDDYCNVNPSLPNYLCLSGATDFGCSGYDGGPNSNACTNSAWNSPNIVDRILGAGLTWKAYMEDMPSNCYGSDSGNYAVRHNPFVYYGDIANDATRCTRVVPAGSPDSALINDLGSTSTASNFMWLTPNTCNDIHSCPIDTGDAYLADLVQRILSSPVFTTQRAALYITFDEGKGNNGQPVYTVWAGRVVKPTYTSSVAYNHFSLLATIESNWNLPNLTANDAGAAAMTEFFTSNPPPSDTVAPTIAIDSPSNHSSAVSPVSVTGTAFDNIAIQKVELRVDGGAWTTATGTTSWSGSFPLAVGNHTIDARVTDTSGNSKAAGISLSVTPGGPPFDFLSILPEIVVGLIVVAAVAGLLIYRRRKKARP